MFKNNMGGMDRGIRAIVGIILLALYFMGTLTGALGWIVMLATAVIGWCPAYVPFGIKTCRTQ